MLNKIFILSKLIYFNLWLYNKEVNLLKTYFFKLNNFLESGKYELIYSSPGLIVAKHERINEIPITLQSTMTELWKRPDKINNTVSCINSFLRKTRESVAILNIRLIKNNICIFFIRNKF